MRTHLILILAFLLAVLNVNYAQNGCLPEGITFSSQAQIDAFPSNYPGCTLILGNVIILEAIEGDITSLDSLYPITAIEGKLEIGHWTSANCALLSLSGLDNLTRIGGNLGFWGNHVLPDLSGLDNLTTLGGYLKIGMYNYALMSLSGLDNLTTIRGGLDVWMGNNSLTSLSGLDNVISIGGRLLVKNNATLESLSGLDNVTAILGDLQVSGNPGLTSLSGLEQVTTIGGDFYVYDNFSLLNFNDLENLTSIGGYLEIRENPILSTCEIQPICDHLANGGSAFIENNAPGCNTQQEVIDACQAVSVDDLILDDAIQLFPNPTTGIVRIEAPEITEWEVSVRDAMGRTIIQPHQLINGEIDLSNVQPGLYFIELNDGLQSVVKRIIKQ